jgi:hypothetical protein
VIGYVGSRVRDHVRNVTGREVPIVESDPVTLTSVVAEIVSNRSRAREIAAEGVAFVREVHDGTKSGQVLGGWIGSAP